MAKTDLYEIARSLKSLVVSLEGSDCPSEDSIRKYAHMVCGTKGIPEDDAERVVRIVLGMTEHLPVEDGVCIHCVHKEWYQSRKQDMEEDDRKLEIRNIKYLKDRLNANVVNRLDKWTSEILDHLGDPTAGSFSRKGLVMGDVQSGKTNTYLLLSSKAIDVGYKVLIILTTNIESLRRQTQQRVDYALVGVDSDAMLDHKSIRLVGVGDIDNTAVVQSFTSLAMDFRKDVAKTLPFQIQSHTMDPCVFVIKKNKDTLASLESWFRSKSEGGRINQSLLLIDDEADYASVNTKRGDEQSVINRHITSILGMFTRASYCGFTATPFANVFIDPDDENNLFPKDFIYCLGRSSNYIGPGSLFSSGDPDEDGGPAYPHMVQRILFNKPDGKDKRDLGGLDELKLKHKKTDRLTAIPDSLRTAIYEFLLSCTIRDLRQMTKSHMSMLINMSRFTDVQDDIGDKVDSELREIREHVEVYGKGKNSERDSRISEIRDVFRQEYEHDSGCTWSQVLEQLARSIRPISVVTVNTRSKEPLSYKNCPDGKRVIAVGGDSLSRGLTLEGLTVSYFYRNSRTYDTLMQMGRWFGYHDDYQELCRVWMTEDSILWYSYINEASENLRDQFYMMARSGRTPADFGLAVKNDLTTLDITSRSKMYNAGGTEYILKSVGGKKIETSYFYVDSGNVRSNHSAVEDAISFMEEAGVAPWHNVDTGNIVWRDVPREAVQRLIERFAVPEQNTQFDQEAILEQLQDTEKISLDRWDVAVVSNKSVSNQYSFMGVPVNMPVRGTVYYVEDERVLRVPKLTTVKDLAEGLYKGDQYDWEKRAELENAYKARVGAGDDAPKRNVPPEAYLTLPADEKRPILLIYFLSFEKEGTDMPTWLVKTIEPLNGIPPIGLAIGYPSSKDLDDAQTGMVLRFRRNKVADARGIEYYSECDE